MTYHEWEVQVPEVIRRDVIWKLESYRLALFLSDLAWQDVTKLIDDRRTIALADQLYRAAGNISSNICEGYSRKSAKDRARFYEYALGSVRECRDWYYKGRFVLGDEVKMHRMDLCTQVIRLVLTAIANVRRPAGASKISD